MHDNASAHRAETEHSMENSGDASPPDYAVVLQQQMSHLNTGIDTLQGPPKLR